MSGFREAQRWLESKDLYPAPGLANVAWSPKRGYLAALTVSDLLILYRVSPPDITWLSEPDLGVAGIEFLGEHHLVCRLHPAPSNAGAADNVTVQVDRQDDDEIRIQIVSIPEPCCTFGMSASGRFLLLGRGHESTDPPGLLDLSSWDNAEPGRHEGRLAVIDSLDLEPDCISYVWISPDGTRLVLRERTSRKSFRDYFVNAREPFTRRQLPDHHWAQPSYLWSPDGRWFAARIMDQTPSDWDEIPVGGPDLQHYIAICDGRTGEQLWCQQVDTAFAPFEWTTDGCLEAAYQVWDPATAEMLRPGDGPLS